MILNLFSRLFLLTIHYSSQDQNRLNITCEKYAIKGDSISTVPYCDFGASLIIHKENTAIYIKNLNSEIFEAFLADKSEIFYFPQNIEKIMSKIKHIKIKNSKLRKITQNDLKNLINLDYLDLSGNEIKILPENLFEFNPNLTKLSFNHNKIFFVDPNAFSFTPNLANLYFNNNKCYSDNGNGFGQSVENIHFINAYCFKNTLENIIKYVEYVDESQQIQIDNNNINIQNLLNQSELQNINDQNRDDLGFLKILANLEPSYVALLTVFNTIIILAMSVILICFTLKKKSANEVLNIFFHIFWGY